MSRRIVLIVALVGVVIGGIFWRGGDDYKVKLLIPSAAQLADGSPVWVNGAKAGSVQSLEVKDGKALVTVSLNDGYAPLRDGTTSRIEWNSALGERMLTLYPGPAGNTTIPKGGMIEGKSLQIEVDQVLAVLDKPTRDKITSLVTELNQTVDGREPDLNATVRSAGSSVQALGSILEAVGRDGPAIRALVTQLQQMVAIGADHRQDLASVVNDLTSATGAVASQQQQLSDGLKELPSTLQTAKGTLDRVPKAGEPTIALLQDLKPATDRLPSVARNLSPVLTELRPSVAELRPTLVSAQGLLKETPGLIDVAHEVVPPAQQFVQAVQPAVAFLRPYTPEGIGMLHNWGQAFAPYDGEGHVWAGLLAPGTNAVDESVVQPPGSRRNPEPYPGQPVGQPVGQPWVDATGSGIR
ncbi:MULTISPECIES: MlaD family protein [Protofrankia]|uniref:Mammalian cell entry related domain protein n=1 Tax=Candidatus Protofrankia datiscae TaxID=2716812 RepID=F8AY49_9ACTN|nr:MULTISPECIES: MlaD family protein [Protofrankia]AEH09479.1 Mammalian cell entry related domain protein [Candidatus Protofrankia datiscae]